jgi:hypothetical protein
MTESHVYDSTYHGKEDGDTSTNLRQKAGPFAFTPSTRAFQLEMFPNYRMRHRSIDTIGPGHFANKSLLKREREKKEGEWVLKKVRKERKNGKGKS